MCGIAGDLRPARPAESPTRSVRAMNDLIRHRGPDDERLSTWSRALGLGEPAARDHRPLAGGHQPMANEDGSRAAHLQRRALQLPRARAAARVARPPLPLADATPRSSLHAYEEWGPDCLSRFNGMFAFAIWDERRRELFLARDRFGIKPLYYARHDGRFVFGSEVKSLLARRHRRAASRPRRSSSTSRSRTSSATGRSSTACACSRPVTRYRRRTAGRRDAAATGTSRSTPTRALSEEEWAEQIRGTLRGGRDAPARRATFRSAATCRAAWTRPRSRPSRRGTCRG